MKICNRPNPLLRNALALGLMLSTHLGAIAQSSCQARSGPKTAALVELYTSEGCSSCPPADKQLSTLRQTLDPQAEVVPLSLHVDYWDYIGWKDPYAQPAFGQRHRALVTANQHKTVYTPHFFVSGGEVREWRGTLRDEVRRINAQPAAAEIRLKTRLTPQGTLAISADASRTSPGDAAQLYVALAEDGLVSRVARGENGGTTLSHNAVVRQWLGPIRLSDSSTGSASLQRELTLDPGWNRKRLSLVAFVQQEGSARVLQALATPVCAGA